MKIKRLMKFQDTKGTGPEQITVVQIVYHKTALCTVLQRYAHSVIWLIDKEQNTHFKIMYNKTFKKSKENSM